MGFDESLLGMSTQDYLLRSVGPVLPLLLSIAVPGLLWWWADPRVTRAIRRSARARRWWPRAAFALAVALPLLVYVTSPWWQATAYTIWPLALAAGVLLLGYAETLRRRRDGAEPARAGLAKVFVLLTVGVCLFWSASNRAEVLGGELADSFAGQLPGAVRVTVYSAERLYLQSDAEGVVEEPLSGTDGAYRYRYRGPRFLDHINERYFLVPDGWTRQRSVLIVLADSDHLRFEFRRDT